MSKLFDIFNRIARIRENKSNKAYDNAFMGDLLMAVMDSGTSRICVDRKASYIYGEGFLLEATANKQANARQDFNKLLAVSAPNLALFKGVCFKIMVDQKGMPYRIYSLPVDKVKKTSDGDYIYNYSLNTDNYMQSHDRKFEAYNPKATPQERIVKLQNELKANNGTQIGTIYYAYNEGIGQDYYPIPPAYSGIEDILSDSELSGYELENLENGFLPSAILTIIGKLDNTIKDAATGKTEADVMKDKLRAFTAKKGGRAKLLVMAAETKEQVPTLQQLDVAQILTGLEKITDRIGRKVCRLFEIPPVLAGFEDASILGSNQTFKNALVSLQHSVKIDQQILINALSAIYPDINFEIKQLKLIDYIPEQVLAKLTDDELRALGGYEPLPKADVGTGISLAQIIGVGGTQSLQAIVTDPNMSQEQKVQVLMILFNITYENSYSMIYGIKPPAA